MANPRRTRQRVHALRRAPDGSAFQKCCHCEAAVPIALIDMHECEAKGKNEVKRFKGVCEKPKVVNHSLCCYQIRSPFRFFMERFVEPCSSGEWIDIDRKGFEAWKNMSQQERRPYLIQAEMLDTAHRKALLNEVASMPMFADDEADSAMVGKYDETMKCLETSGFESWNVDDWEMDPWNLDTYQSSWLPFL